LSEKCFKTFAQNSHKRSFSSKQATPSLFYKKKKYIRKKGINAPNLNSKFKQTVKQNAHQSKTKPKIQIQIKICVKNEIQNPNPKSTNSTTEIKLKSNPNKIRQNPKSKPIQNQNQFQISNFKLQTSNSTSYTQHIPNLANRSGESGRGATENETSDLTLLVFT
jgi:hypothetical protein